MRSPRLLFISALIVLIPALAWAQDVNPPALVEFDLTPTSIDITAGPQVVTVTARATDDVSGPNYLQVTFTSPSGSHYQSGNLNRSGPVNTTLDATFAGNVTIPQYNEPGTWRADVRLFDNAGNSVQVLSAELAAGGFPSELDVASSLGTDTIPAALVEFDFTPTAVDVGDSFQVVTVNARATDDLSGPGYLEVGFRSPSGSEYYTARLNRSGPVDTMLDATFSGNVTIPQTAEVGTWTGDVWVWDNAGNGAYLGSADLATRGFRTELQVASTPPPEGSDTTPPTLAEFSFTPTSIDVTGAPREVAVTARMTDDLSGPGYIAVYFRSPSGIQYHSAGLTRTSTNTRLDATYGGAVTIPQYVEAGTWTVEVYLGDNVGNRSYLVSSNLAALGFPTELDVASNPDTTPPVVASAAFSPALIDVSSADQVVTLDVRLTDDVSGLGSGGTPSVSGYINGPTGANRYYVPSPDFTMISGGPLDSTWRMTWTIPRYSEAGTWRMYLYLRDNAGNYSYLPAGTFDVTADTQDLTAPVLTGLRFSPAVINTSASDATVTVSLDLTDDLSGVDFSNPSIYGGYFHGLTFSSPSNGQSRSVCCGSFTMSAGTVLNGTWQAEVHFPRYSEAGTWTASVVNVTDHVRNSLDLSAAQLAALGFTADVVVVRPSLVGDGNVDSVGGTVTDETYGDRAALTFPPDAVSTAIDVALDVFPDPLAVPTPSGFQGPGSYFVNISLTPEPAYPFAAPGVTATLPLPNFLNPGTTLPLFFVNTTTGTLEPMPDASTGMQVVGTVNADGLSATFTGISHFSILVGMIPDVIQVGLDIRPRTLKNPVSGLGKGRIPVAILSTPTLNAPMAVNRSSLTFGKTGDEASLIQCNDAGEDVDGDGLLDLVCEFSTQATGFVVGDTLGVLRGQTMSSEHIMGSDVIYVIP